MNNQCSDTVCITNCTKWYEHPKNYPPEVLASPLELNTITGITLPEFLLQNAQKWHDKPAIKCGQSGRQYCYGDLYTKSSNFAAALIDQGYQRQDVICILLPNLAEYPIVYLGLMKAGVVPCPLNPSLTKDEIIYVVQDSRAKSIITMPHLVHLVNSVKECCSSLTEKFIITDHLQIPGCNSFFDMIEVDSTNVNLVTGNDIDTTQFTCLLAASSGTTGFPKCVEHTHDSLVNSCIQMSHPDFCQTRQHSDTIPQDRHITILPFYHMYGLHVLLSVALRHGVFMYSLPKFEPKAFVKTLHEHKPTMLHLVTPLINWMVQDDLVKPDDLNWCRGILIGGSPVGKELMRRFQIKFKSDLFMQEAYAMTEIMLPVLVPKQAQNLSNGSAGTLTPGSTCKVVDVDTGALLGANKSGELCFQNKGMMKGYLRNEDATKATIQNGWIHSGDIGYYDDRGFFYIVDRLKDLIKVNALQVAPSELENVIRQHSEISDVAVIGVKHERMGEAPRAYVVKKNDNLTEQDICEFIKSKLAPYKQLAGGVEFVEQIPKLLSGKILRRQLLDKYNGDST